MASGTETPARAPAAPQADASLWRKALRRVIPAWTATGLFTAAVNLLMLTGSIYMLQIYDRVLSSGSVPTLLALFAIVVVLYGFLGLFDGLRARLLSRAAHRLDADLGPAACGLWLGSGNSGRQASVMSDLDTVRSFIASAAMRGLFDLPFMPLFLGVLFLLHPWLGWLTLAGAGVTALAAWLGRLSTTGTLNRGKAAQARARSFAEGAERDAEATVAMGMRPALVARWQELHETALAHSQAGADRADQIAAFSRSFRMLLQSAILTLGAWLVIKGDMSAGAIVASSILSGRALAPIDQAIGQWKAIADARGAWTRLGAAFRAPAAQAAPATELPAPTGRIRVDRISKLAPGQSDRRLLTQVDFSLDPGDGLGVIGNSASGKSTLARCLTGVWTPEFGEIRLDGATLDQWDPARLGRHIGYLPQSVTLLPGTIRDTIARMDPAITDTQVIEAARLAGIHEMILKLPDGYDTMVGPSAPPLSGGQVQRIGLARALCGMPRIVVLDEPNSNLDTAGDEALNQAITALRKAGSTVIVMAHRPSAIAAVNKLLILQDGMVARFGDKAELMAAKPDAPARGKAPVQALHATPPNMGTNTGAAAAAPPDPLSTTADRPPAEAPAPHAAAPKPSLSPDHPAMRLRRIREGRAS